MNVRKRWHLHGWRLDTWEHCWHAACDRCDWVLCSGGWLTTVDVAVLHVRLQHDDDE